MKSRIFENITYKKSFQILEGVVAVDRRFNLPWRGSTRSDEEKHDYSIWLIGCNIIKLVLLFTQYYFI